VREALWLHPCEGVVVAEPSQRAHQLYDVGIQDDVDVRVCCGLPMPHIPPRAPDSRTPPRLARQGLARILSILDLSAGKFPQAPRKRSADLRAASTLPPRAAKAHTTRTATLEPEVRSHGDRGISLELLDVLD
jgi:hypothetical protein